MASPGFPAAFLSPLVWSHLCGGLLTARLPWGALGGLPEAFPPLQGRGLSCWPCSSGPERPLAPSMAQFRGDRQQRPPEAPPVASPSCGVLELPDEGAALVSGASERLQDRPHWGSQELLPQNAARSQYG